MPELTSYHFYSLIIIITFLIRLEHVHIVVDVIFRRLMTGSLAIATQIFQFLPNFVTKVETTHILKNSLRRKHLNAKSIIQQTKLHLWHTRSNAMRKSRQSWSSSRAQKDGHGSLQVKTTTEGKIYHANSSAETPDKDE